MLQTMDNSNTVGAEVLLNVVREFVGAMQSGGYPVNTDDTIPDVVRNHVINRTRWLWLIEFPQLKKLQTEERREANTAAEKVLQQLSTREMNVEPPTAAVTSSGNWNSENKVVGRMNPVPRPGLQSQGGYANPDGPADQGADEEES